MEIPLNTGVVMAGAVVAAIVVDVVAGWARGAMAGNGTTMFTVEYDKLASDIAALIPTKSAFSAAVTLEAVSCLGLFAGTTIL